MGRSNFFLHIFLIPFLLSACVKQRNQTENFGSPPGADKSASHALLEQGAALLQNFAPLQKINLLVVGVHPMKEDPSHQMLVYHFCHQMNEEFAQCILYEDDSADARMNGIEYIISERLFEGLPEEEKPYWHPHNYEILSGTLVAPGVPAPAEKEALRRKINSYGKTWHVWMTDGHGESNSSLPMGPPMLGWSVNRDGEARTELLKEQEARLGVNLEEKRKEREDMRSLAKPQQGEDALLGRF